MMQEDPLPTVTQPAVPSGYQASPAAAAPAPVPATAPAPAPTPAQVAAAPVAPAPAPVPAAAAPPAASGAMSFDAPQLNFKPLDLPVMPTMQTAAAVPAAVAAAPAPAAAVPVAAPLPTPAAQPATAEVQAALAAAVAPSDAGPTAASSSTASASADAAPAEADSEEAGSIPIDMEPTGLLGIGTKILKEKSSQLAEHEKVQQGISYIKDKATAVAENEKVQQGVSYVKGKASEIQESERFQKGVEKTKEAIDYAKEKTKDLQEKAGNVWSAGRGSISKVKANVSKLSWKGSARDTLDIAAREEQWKGIKVQGAEEISVPARTEHTCCYHVSKGSTLRWTFRVKDHDIGFGVRMRVAQYGGAVEEDVLPVEKYDNEDTVSGSWVADQDRTMVLVFDNRYSKLRAKTVAYFTGTEKPAAFTEAPQAAVV